MTQALGISVFLKPRVFGKIAERIKCNKEHYTKDIFIKELSSLVDCEVRPNKETEEKMLLTWSKDGYGGLTTSMCRVHLSEEMERVLNENLL